MPVDVILVLVISASVIGFAVWRGGKPEMLGAGVVVFNLLIDPMVRAVVGQWDFSTFSSSRFVVDLVEFGLLFSLALHANRVWPIFSAASQLVAVGGSLAVLESGGGMQIAYWAITQLPLFGQLAALAFGTFFHLRRQAAIGPYRDWRATYSPQL